MSLNVKRVKGPYVVAFRHLGSQELWALLDSSQRATWWRAFWASMQKSGSLLNSNMFKLPGESGASEKMGSLPPTLVNQLWERNKTPHDREDKAIQAANVAAWQAISDSLDLVGNAADDVHVQRAPILGIDPQDPSAISLVVGGVAAAGDAVVNKAKDAVDAAKDTVDQVKKIIPKASFGAGAVVALMVFGGLAWLVRR